MEATSVNMYETLGVKIIDLSKPHVEWPPEPARLLSSSYRILNESQKNICPGVVVKAINFATIDPLTLDTDL